MGKIIGQKLKAINLYKNWRFLNQHSHAKLMLFYRRSPLAGDYGEAVLMSHILNIG
jgi:hypothetical protein